MRKIYRTLLCASVILLLGTVSVFAQKRSVTGKITDAANQGIPGVNVMLKGTTVGTSTDADGVFTIEATPSDVLVVSFIGYKPQEVAVGSQTRINVQLTEDIATLQEVVVVGYVAVKREDLTSAQTSITSSDLNKTVNTTIEQAIQGRSAGVYVTQNSGQPGGGMSVVIRGVNSINGTNEPLYVVDGVQIQGQSVSFGAQSSSNPLAGLNPGDIEDVQILQGPSATAQYGSRATNGVVIITTKRGKAGDTKVSYGYQYSAQTPPKPLEIMNLPQYAQMVKEFHAIAGGTTPVEFLDPSLLGNGTDWQAELFKTAPMNKHQLSLSGGEKTTYYLSGEYLKQEGVAIGSGFDRYSIRLNVDNKPREWATIGANINFNQTQENLTTTQENVIQNALQLTPQIPVKNIDGSWGGGDETNGANQYAPVNPVALANLTTNEYTRRQFIGGLNLGVTLMKGLTLSTSLNTNVGFFNSDYFIPKYKFGFQQNPIARSTTGSGTNTWWSWNQRLDYSKQIGSHSFSALLLHEAQESSWSNLSGTRTGYLTNDVIDLNAGDPLTAENGGGRGDWAMESYLASVNYNFRDRYILMASIRRDGSVNFGPENKWGTFPALSLAWRISQESFFNIPVINELKLRLETGVTGNQGGSGAIYSPLQSGATPWGTGFLPSKYSNPNLGWEETLTKNIGINIGLLESRIQLEFDYYIKDTDNLLLDNPLPWYMGTNGTGSIGSPTVNIGSLQNKGWGLTLNAAVINHGYDGLRWNVNFNISGFETKVKAFYSDAALINRTSWWLADWTQQSVVGRAPWQFLGYIEDGLFQSIEEIENSALPVDNSGNKLPINEENGVWVGDVKFRDISGPEGVPDGIIDVNDQTFIGNPWPKMFAGFTNTFSYKGFDLSILITGTYGNDIYNYVAKVNTNPNNINLSRNLMVDVLNYARVTTDEQGNPMLENPETNVARISYGPNDNYERHTSRWVEDGSYIRLKNVSLSYNVPSSLLSKQKILKSLRVTLTGQNLATITKYKGFDPEVGAYVGRDVSASNQAIGLDYGRYPLTPVYSIGINADF
ncbi:MAG: TonB-dependent receptor [Cyclobacteriaceae bacterium]|nr:TonB-dependent receptor [Cyclobacteriaceae bacterium]